MRSANTAFRASRPLSANDPNVLTETEKCQLPTDVLSLGEAERERVIDALAQQRMTNKIDNSNGLLKPSDRLYQGVRLECLAAVLGLVREAREKLDALTRKEIPFKEALERLGQIPFDPLDIEKFVVSLERDKLISRSERWWWVGAADHISPASCELAGAINEKRATSFIARINNCPNLNRLKAVAESYINGGMVERVIDHPICPRLNPKHIEFPPLMIIPNLVARAFNDRREVLLAGRG